MTAPGDVLPAVPGFRHEALLYEGDDGFVSSTLPFLEGALATGDPTLVMVPAAKIALLRSALGETAGVLHFADMEAVGRNPARIIPAWQEFLSSEAGSGRMLRGIGEPIWPGRRRAELVECQLHEALLNRACATSPAFWLVCPYDTAALDPAVVDVAWRTHPHVVEQDERWYSPEYEDMTALPSELAGPLPEPPHEHLVRVFDGESLRGIRDLVTRYAEDAGQRGDLAADFALAVHEAATNSVEHGGGRGTVRLWSEHGNLVSEVRDLGHVDEPLAGRRRPHPHAHRGRGLWLANHLCDLVQLRSADHGTVVRLHMRLAQTSGYPEAPEVHT